MAGSQEAIVAEGIPLLPNGIANELDSRRSSRYILVTRARSDL